MVVNDDLPVLRRPNLRPGCVVAGRSLGVDVDDLAVSLVLEQQPRFPVGDDLLVYFVRFIAIQKNPRKLLKNSAGKSTVTLCRFGIVGEGMGIYCMCEADGECRIFFSLNVWLLSHIEIRAECEYCFNEVLL